MKNWAVAIGLGLGCVIGVVLLFAAVVAFYGAIIGGIGGAAYWAFKLITGS